MNTVFSGGKEETNIWLKCKWCSDRMRKTGWWWLWEGIWLLSWLLPSNIYSHRIWYNVSRLLSSALLITNLIWIVWTRIALSAVLCWAWRHYFSYSKRPIHIAEKYVKNLWYFIPCGRRNTWIRKTNRHWNMGKRKCPLKEVPKQTHVSALFFILFLISFGKILAEKFLLIWDGSWL